MGVVTTPYKKDGHMSNLTQHQTLIGEWAIGLSDTFKYDRLSHLSWVAAAEITEMFEFDNSTQTFAFLRDVRRELLEIMRGSTDRAFHPETPFGTGHGFFILAQAEAPYNWAVIMHGFDNESQESCLASVQRRQGMLVAVDVGPCPYGGTTNKELMVTVTR